MYKIDLTGQTFGYLKVIGFSRTDKNSHSLWLCECACGKQKEFNSNHLRRGSSRSCGCLKGAMITESKTRHGMYGTKTYKAWNGLRQRCNNPKENRYHRYGGRGITYCPDWEIFENFLKDMGEAPPGMTLDRINVNGNYCKENCRWVTWKDQQRNRGNNKHIEWNGQVKTLSEWADELGMNQDTLGFRLNDGWTVERAFTQPVKKRTIK